MATVEELRARIGKKQGQPTTVESLRARMHEGQPTDLQAQVATIPATQSQALPLSAVPGQALANLPASAAQFGQDILQPFLSPIETAKSLGNVALGGIQKLIPGEQSSEPYAEAVANFFAKRYGGWENVKRTMATDPVGFLADLSTVLTAGGAMAARAPGAIGQVGRAAATAGRFTDPIRGTAAAMAPVARLGGRGIAEIVGTLGTHTGGQSLRTAGKAGLEGGESARALRESMRGARPMEDVVLDAKRAVGNIRQGRGAEYRKGMAEVARDKTILDFAPIDRALSKATDIKRYKGQPIGKATAVTDEITEAVNQWKMLDPAEFHTPEGLDALKQKIGAIRDSTPYGTPERLAADTAYNAIKDQIVAQAPKYAQTMRAYWEASDLIKEMERTLSLNPKASMDTQLRKLQSLMRNNANTNYGRRLVLGEILQEAGATTLMEQLAGQALEPIAPRGLGRVVAGGAALGGVGLDPALLALLPLQSPRLMGEAAYLGGAGLRQAGRLPALTSPALFQAGRTAGLPR